MKRILTYTIVGLLSPAITLLLLPVYLKYFSTSEYVIIALTNSFLAVFSIFFNLKVDHAMRTLFFYDSQNTNKQESLFRTLFTFQILSFALWLCLFLLIGKPLFEILFKNPVPFFPYSFIILATFLVNSLSNFYFIYLQNKLEVKTYSLLNISNTLLINGLQLCCIYVLKLEFIWFLLSSLLSNCIIFGYIYFKNLALFRLQLSKPILLESLTFSLPFIPFVVFYALENQLDKFFIDQLLSAEILAKYTVLLSVSAIISLLLNSLDNAIRPELFTLFSSNTSKEKVQYQLDFYIMIGLWSLSFLMLFGLHIDWFLNHPKYVGIAKYFPWISLAFVPLIVLRFYALQLIFEKKVPKMNAFILVKVLFMFLLFWCLIPRFELYGCITTLALSNVINLILFYTILSTKFIPSKKVILTVILFLMLNVLICTIRNSNLVSLSSLLLFLVLSYLFINTYKNDLKKIFYKN